MNNKWRGGGGVRGDRTQNGKMSADIGDLLLADTMLS